MSFSKKNFENDFKDATQYCLSDLQIEVDEWYVREKNSLTWKNGASAHNKRKSDAKNNRIHFYQEAPHNKTTHNWRSFKIELTEQRRY